MYWVICSRGHLEAPPRGNFLEKLTGKFLNCRRKTLINLRPIVLLKCSVLDLILPQISNKSLIE